MHRRTFLGTVGATALAGCTATGDDAQTESTGNATTTDGRTATATDTPTETPTETATELPPNPTIEAVNVLTHWEESAIRSTTRRTPWHLVPRSNSASGPRYPPIPRTSPSKSATNGTAR
ncbi:hypothetical protein VB779_15890 [Haloarculaceae archaeon H-GB11]|nr:hypothetical protein [Haloarculaceae archaeon H-GB11]